MSASEQVVPTSTTSAKLPRTLGLIDSLSIVIGVTIGGGIFLIPNLVARQLPTVTAILGVWIFAGLISFFGALACAELGTMFPSTGGQYVFLRESYGPLMGFLCGWSTFLVARTAQVAWLAMTLALYVSYFIPMSAQAEKLFALAALVVFTGINYWGAKTGAFVQNTFTFAKVVGLLSIIGGALLLGGKPAASAQSATGAVTMSGFGIALVACVLAYDGWVQLSFVAGEIRDPKRNVLLALAIGSAACIFIYVLANVAYLRVLSIPEIAASSHVGADAVSRVMGSAGGKIVSLIILVSIIGSLNGCFLTSPRVYFAQAQDGLFFRKFAEVHPTHKTPAFAIIAQGVWAAVLLLTGGYESLIDYAMFGLWIFYGFMIAGLIVLRIKRPDLPRPYRMWGYPVTPIVFLGITAWFLGNMLVTRPVPSLVGLGLTAAGIPVYFLWSRRAKLSS
jgi:APA family basic amino acid/polyamine antiporter